MEGIGRRRAPILAAIFIIIAGMAAGTVSSVSVDKTSGLHRSHRDLVKRSNDYPTNDDDLALGDGAYDDPQNDEDGEVDDEDFDSSEVDEPYTGPPPSIKSAGRNVTVSRGDSVWLPCETANAESFVIMWSKGQDILYQGEFKTTSNEKIHKFNNKTLSISRLELGDDGVYTCTVAGANGPSPSVTYNVQFFRPANVTRVLPEGNARLVREGEPLEIRCETSGTPRPKLTWSKKGQRLTKDDVEFGEQYIYIKQVNKDHAGMYQCLASNGVGGPAHGAVDIKVLYAPQVHIRKTAVNTAENFETELSCGVHSEPASTIQWIKDGHLVVNSATTRLSTHANGQHSTLKILRVAPQDFGKYTCKAQNQYGEDSKSVRLIAQPGLAEFLRQSTDNDGISPVLEWAIESNQPLTHVELKYRRIDEAQPEKLPAENDWIMVTPQFEKPSDGSKYVIRHALKDLRPGKYEARLKSRNTKGWSDISDGQVFDGDSETNEIRQSSRLEEAPLEEVKTGASAKNGAGLLTILASCLLVRLAA